MILRLLHWLACFLRRIRPIAQPQSMRAAEGAKPEGTADEGVVTDSSTSFFTGSEQTCDENRGGAHESQEKAVQSSDRTEARTLNETAATPGHGRAEGQRDTSSQPAIKPALENASLPLPSPQPPVPPGYGERDESAEDGSPTTVESAPPVDVEHNDGMESELPRETGSEATELQPGESKEPIIPPEKRGGRSRAQRSTDDGQAEQETRARTPRPEIVCWKRAREWVVGVDIPDGISGGGNIAVLQADAPLSKDDSRDGCWRLDTLNTPVEIRVVGGDNRTIDIPLGNEAWLLFKLSGTGLEQGRKVRQVSSGSYLAIVPKTWRREETRAGNAPTTPEHVFLEGYLAHFFAPDDTKSTCIAFCDDRETLIDIGGSVGAQFRLDGVEIHDASEGIGPLFGGVPPRICIANGQWSDVGTIVVGQEGSGRQRWRKGFEPIVDQAEQELPLEVLERKAGWYFLRFYDRAGTLIDSLDFRFVAGLKGISVPTASPAPSPHGHVAQEVKILHDAGYSVSQPGLECPGINVKRRTDGTIVTIPPTAECDHTRWLIQPPNGHGQEVEFTILVERLWWAPGTDDAKPSTWEGRPVPLSPKDFAATSNKAVWLRFPTPRWVSEVSAGFCRERSRKFQVNVADTTIAIPLREFSGAQELDDQAHEHKVKVWLEFGRETCELTIALLPVQEDKGDFDLASIPAHRLATILTRLRRAARGPARRLIKKVRSQYRRTPRSRPERNEEFVKEALCLIAIFLERAGNQLYSRHLSNYWKRNARLARQEFPDTAQEFEEVLFGIER